MPRPDHRRHDRGRDLARLTLMVAAVEIELWLPWDARLEPLRWLLRGTALTVFLWSLLDRREAGAADAVVGRRAAWLEAGAATLVAGAGLAAWISLAREPYDEPDLAFLASAPAFSAWAAHRLSLAAVQQLFLQLFFLPVLLRILNRERAALLAAAALFGAFHLPSPGLVAGTFLGAVVWILLYRRSRRLLPLILAHGLLAGFASAAAPEHLFHEMRAGARALGSLPAYRILAREETRSLLRQLTATDYVACRGGTGAGWVQGLYRDVLGRPATPEEVSYQARQLAETSAAAVAKRVVTSEEALDSGGRLAARVLDYLPKKPGLLRFPSTSITYLDDEYFVAGFSIAEESLRWSQEPVARLVYPLRRIDSGRRYALRLEAGTLGRQRVKVFLNGGPLQWWELKDMRPQVRVVDVDAARLRSGANQVELRLPDARSTAEDPRLLGVALVSVRIYPLPGR